MEVVVGVAIDKLNKLVDQAILQACYPFRFNNYVKELETEKEKLQSKIQEVLDRAKDAKKGTHKISIEVEKWLDEANFLMAKVLELQEKTEKRNKTSYLKHCPNLISRYSLAKQLEVKTNEIIRHNQVQFSEFSRLATLVGMNYFSSQDFVHFESRKVAYDGLLRALGDDEIHMIGLYGMGGSGKTTLVKEVGIEAETFFDKVVFVVVSNPIDVRKIQSKIAGQLNLELKEEENLERAQRLFMRLTCGERFLIILDDVWEKLDFVDIGIPIANNQNSCTTLITTRKFDVCKLMNCQKIIHLEGLNEDESWALFQKHAGLFGDQFDTLKDMAQKITKECDGLPVAIAAVASALKDKPYDEWVEALEILRDPGWIDIEEGLKSTYGCLRLSYDNLANEVAKSLFLLCSMYPEDYEIRIDQLAIVGLRLGLAGDIPSYHARTQVINKSIKKLIDSCLLLKVQEDDDRVKMHDLIRDVALWIAKKDNTLIMGQLKGDMMMKDHAIRYLWLEEVDKCPNNLKCPEIEFLYTSIYSEPCVAIPNDFFKGMENLRVLILENPTDKEDLSLQLPSSVHLMNNLRCLMLYCWVLGDISFIGSLESLESLTIRECSFDELPECIIQQTKLRFIDLCRCKIQRNPFEVMGRCSRLEVLYFCGNSGIDWEDRIKNSVECFHKISTTTPALESYCLHFGNRDKDSCDHACYWKCYSFVERGLYIEDFENCISVVASKDMMRRAKGLSLRGIPISWKNIIPDLWQTIGGGMNELTHLALHDSDGIKCVIGDINNLRQHSIISNLKCLNLTKVKHLKTLCSGQASQHLFANLEVLRIASCDSLEHIITEVMNEIVDGSEDHSYGNAFPKLKKLSVGNCKKLEYLMPISFAKNLVHLENLYVGDNYELRSVFGRSLHRDLNLSKPYIVEFSTLKHLELRNLSNTITICPKNYHPTWPSLKWLQLENCPKLNIKSINHWVACGALRQEDDLMNSEDLLKAVVTLLETLVDLDLFDDKIEVVFDVERPPINAQVKSSLRDMILCNLPRLRHLWWGPKNSLLLQHLDRLRLVRCGILKKVFPSSVLQSFPHLRVLYIEDCNELEKIIEEDDQNASSSRELAFPRIVSINIKRCHKLKCVFPMISICRLIPKLRVLSVVDAFVLEQAFGHEENDTTTTSKVITPALEYVLLWNLPSLTSVAPFTALQTIRYIVVQQCPRLSLTSSVAPQELLKQLSKGYLDERYLIKVWLEDMIKSMDDSGRETAQQIDCQETAGQSNDQKLIASPNLIENKQESEDQSAGKQETSEEKRVEGRTEECTTSENLQIVTSLAHSKPESSTKIQSQIKFNPGKSNVEDLKDDDLISVLESIEDDYGGKSPILSISTVATAKHELVAKALEDLEDSLKMPLKDIATSEANSLRLQTALNFLSRLTLEDGALSHGFMAIIKSMHKDLPNILSSFKQAFATVNKFAVLEERDESMKDELTQRKEVAFALVSKISETEKFVDEAREKKARLQEQISRLEKEITDCEAELLSLQEPKRECIAEAVELKKRIEAVRKEKSKMVEDQRNAGQQLFQVDHKWSVLGSQFELNIANKISLDAFLLFTVIPSLSLRGFKQSFHSLIVI